MMLLGLLALWHWEVAGSVLVIAGALAAWGGPSFRFLPFFGVTVLPAVLQLVCAWRRRAMQR